MKAKKEYKQGSSRVIGNVRQKCSCAKSSNKCNSSIQRQTYFNQRGQTYHWRDEHNADKTTEVGKSVEVWLDPNSMIQGQSANLNTSQDGMMGAIRNRWNIWGGGIVKGHLWNDNLGGNALNNNLYPITKAANADHLRYIENVAKSFVFQKIPIYYKVEVDANPYIDEPIAEFDCEVREWNPQRPCYAGNLLHSPITIHSDLRNVGAYNEAYETYTGLCPRRVGNPRFPNWLRSPKTKVSDLTDQEKRLRSLQGK